MYFFKGFMEKILHILLVFTILMSLSGIDKVLFISYSAITNSDKAAHLCSCSACSVTDSESGESSFCHTGSKADNTEKFCHTNSGDHSESKNGTSICSCNSDSGSPQDSVIFNTLDKVTLLESRTIRRFLNQTTLGYSFIESATSYLLKEVFRPPRI